MDIFCFYRSAESLKLSADFCVCFFENLNVQEVGSTVHGSMNQKIWVCYLPLGWSECISVPAYFFPFSLSRPILFSFKHTYMLYMSMSVLFTSDASVCQCIMNFYFSFLKETLCADTSVIECLLSFRLKFFEERDSWQ